MDAIYCTNSDVYAFGVPRGAVANPGRLVQSVASASDEFSLRDHGFSTGDPVSFRAEAGGVLPSPIAQGTQYYAIERSADRFAVSTVLGGAAIDFAPGASNVLVISPLPIEAKRRYASRIIDDLLPSHVVPLVEPYPEIVVMSTAELAAGLLGRFVREGVKDLASLTDSLQARLAKWGRGVPPRAAEGQAPANCAVSSVALGRPLTDSRGWLRYGGL